MSVKTLPSQTHIVEVRLKPEFADAEGAGAFTLLREQGLSALREVRCGRLYELTGPLTLNQAQQAARDVLCDNVTQEHRLISPTAVTFNGMNAWRVEVWLKSGVSDPVGQTAAVAIADAGYPGLSARCGTLYRVLGRAMKPQLERAVLRCLANPLIHRVVVCEAHG